MKIKNLTTYLESIAPSSYQESYDNSGLIVGDPNAEITGVLVCLDSTEAIIDEATELGCNVVVAHHPIVFKGLKRFNGRNYVERTVMKAIKNDVAIYAIHTNLDNVYRNGVNGKITEKLGLENTRILAPKQRLKKLFTFVPATHSESLRDALFAAGAGQVNGFDQMSYATLGVGTVDGQVGAQMKLEVVFETGIQAQILAALHKNHPAENTPYDLMSIENSSVEIGSGMIGNLNKPMKPMAFLKILKEIMQAGCVRYTNILEKDISTVAVCGGSGGFLLNAAIRQKADIFITADYKYHEFFDADNNIIIADIGHYESEQYTIELLHGLISKKFTTFAAHFTKVNTNPVNYL
ncbi:MAG: dinuclear metal center YbgI/SA1388 family protein [Paraglaciecola sp.]|jgi:dinuclear metal center YbgI/SA1388 family protein